MESVMTDRCRLSYRRLEHKTSHLDPIPNHVIRGQKRSGHEWKLRANLRQIFPKTYNILCA